MTDCKHLHVLSQDTIDVKSSPYWPLYCRYEQINAVSVSYSIPGAYVVMDLSSVLHSEQQVL